MTNGFTYQSQVIFFTRGDHIVDGLGPRGDYKEVIEL